MDHAIPVVPAASSVRSRSDARGRRRSRLVFLGSALALVVWWSYAQDWQRAISTALADSAVEAVSTMLRDAP